MISNVPAGSALGLFTGRVTVHGHRLALHGCEVSDGYWSLGQRAPWDSAHHRKLHPPLGSPFSALSATHERSAVLRCHHCHLQSRYRRNVWARENRCLYKRWQCSSNVRCQTVFICIVYLLIFLHAPLTQLCFLLSWTRARSHFLFPVCTSWQRGVAFLSQCILETRSHRPWASVVLMVWREPSEALNDVTHANAYRIRYRRQVPHVKSVLKMISILFSIFWIVPSAYDEIHNTHFISFSSFSDSFGQNWV